MASGWIRAGSFKAAYQIIQRTRGGAGGRFYSRMMETEIFSAVSMENIPAEADARTYGNQAKSGAKQWFSSPCGVQVGMTVMGMEEILANFGALTANVRQAAAEVLIESGDRIKTESQTLVPYEIGDLHDSWFPNEMADGVYTDGNEFRLEIGYKGTDQGGVEYAWKQHEEATYEHHIHPTTPSGQRPQWKFLEYPANDERVRMMSTAMEKMREAVARMGGVGTMPAATSRGLGTISGPRLVKKPKG